MVPENVSNSLVRNVVAEVGEGARDPIVDGTAVLFGQADDELLDLWADSRSARIGAMLGSIELAGDQATIPAENRLRLATQATSERSLRPSRRPISASVRRSESESPTLPGRCERRIRFSATRYSH